MARNDYIALASQSAFGTASTTWAFFPPVTSCDLDGAQNLMEIEETTGSYAPEDLEYGTKDVSGNIELAARPDSLGAFLSMAFGEPTTTATVAAEVFSHVFAVGTAPTYWSVLKVNADPSTDIVRSFQDVAIDSFGFTVAPNDYMQLTLGCMGTDFDLDATGTSVTRDSTPKFHFNHVAVQVALVGGSYADAATGELTGTITNGLDGENWQLGSRTRYDIKAYNRNANLDLLLLGNESTYYAASLADTAAAYKLKVTCTGDTFHTAGETPHKYALTFEFPRVQVASAPAPVSASDQMKGIEVSFRASSDPTTGDICNITLVNDNDGDDYYVS